MEGGNPMKKKDKDFHDTEGDKKVLHVLWIIVLSIITSILTSLVFIERVLQ